ncbi:hypothetical protein BGZ49_004514 [Haplosporangium sp. Z 27]|nr:hypothetical protein BGZ49_004514 [Haplosporangium sp. Z 27]
MATIGPQSAIQPNSLHHQKRYSRMENEPETPVPSSYAPIIPSPVDTLKQISIPNSIDIVDQSVHGSYLPTNNGPVSEPASPSPPYPLYNTNFQGLSAAALQNFPDLSSSPEKGP